MDHITHEMRLANWKTVVEQCHARPDGQSAKQWLAEHGINEKRYYYWQRRIRKEAYAQLIVSKVAWVEMRCTAKHPCASLISRI